MQSNTPRRHVLVELLEEGGVEMRSYSGRGMYGDKCLGLTGDIGTIVGEIVGACLDAAEDLALESKEEVERAIRGMRVDSMGRDVVVYFPRVAYEEPDADEGDDDDLECVCPEPVCRACDKAGR